MWQEYMAEAVRVMGEGKYITKSFNDILHPAPADERTYEEIVSEVMTKCGLTWAEEAENESV